ncbi:hypothetical protein ANN_18738 [Periplaneta americana]|uniref:Uncharacterized protein n=1 Tax=Periplaneta americana TaxID=6978 RepID=A0ABQ8SQW5_PERAM|nr:hypothetical protein ANN_18738 [Periplaneta americana]
MWPKGKWREILSAWKQKNRGTLPKDQFPALLRKVLEELNQDNVISSNLKSEFRACSIHPIDRQQVLKRIPVQNSSTSIPDGTGKQWRRSLQEFLSATRTSENTTKTKNCRTGIAAGRSLVEEDFTAIHPAYTVKPRNRPLLNVL